MQERNIGRKLVGGSSTVAGIAVKGDLGWRKLEERREENKLLFGWRLQRMSKDRLVSKVVALLNNCLGWWAEYCELKRKFVMGGELKVVWSHATWRNCMWDVHEERWQEEVKEKSSLKWYRLAKEDFGQERCLNEFGSKGEMRLRFRLRTVSAGLLGDMERFGM